MAATLTARSAATLTARSAATVASLASCQEPRTKATVNARACCGSRNLGFAAEKRLTGRSQELRQAITKASSRSLVRKAAAVTPMAEAVERSYIMIKPDGVQRGLVGDIIARFERKGFVLRGLKLFQCPEELAKEHYKELSDKPFYGKLVEYIVSGPVVAMVWEGKGVVASARKLIGATNPLAAEPGTIRGDLAVEVGRNVVHGSDSIENGEREIGLWFKEGELCDWEPVATPWLRE